MSKSKPRATRAVRNRHSWRAAALVGLGAFGLGAIAALGFAQMPTPEWLPQATVAAAEIATVPRTYNGRQTVPALPEISSETALTAPMAGMLREFECEPGQIIDSGSSPALIDDKAILALHTDVPLWRDLAYGLHGDDVETLQTELARLGQDVTPTGRFATGTAAAVRHLWAEARTGPRNSTVPIAQIVWLPSPEVEIASCDVAVGDRIEAGAKLATIGGRLESLTIDPTQLPAGHSYVLVIPGSPQRTPLPADGVITDHEFLDSFAATAALDRFIAGETSNVNVAVEFDSPVDVVSVPASALFDVSGTRGCVISEDGPLAVTVMASEFGQTMIAADPLPTRVHANPVDPALTCG